MIETGRFPANARVGEDGKRDQNLAIGLFGRRFYNDQSVVEYLAEFLLVLGSKKRADDLEIDAPFPPSGWSRYRDVRYYPPHRVPLKLFAFFATSKLETRHVSHRRAYERALAQLEGHIKAHEPHERAEFVRGLQALLNGFVGVAGNRTWVTQAFLPVTRSLLAREIVWHHAAAKKDTSIGVDWEQATSHFDASGHNFYARGGEHLYLQLAQLFDRWDDEALVAMRQQPAYRHLPQDGEQLRREIEAGLTCLFDSLEPRIGRLANFVSGVIDDDLPLRPTQSDDVPAHFGWIPSTCLPEAMLFAYELRNLLSAHFDPLKRIECLQLLCALHALRSLCFQAARYVVPAAPLDFIGGYSWVAAPPSRHDSDLRKLAERNYVAVEQLLQRAIRSGEWPGRPTALENLDKAWKDADAHSHKLMRKLGKAIGLVVPIKGPGMRFVLSEELVRMLVPALMPSGTRMRESEFRQRLFLHYGLALGDDQAAEAAAWTSPGTPPMAGWPEPAWFIETLRAGGFLIPLSDAVSMVRNPH